MKILSMFEPWKQKIFFRSILKMLKAKTRVDITYVHRLKISIYNLINFFYLSLSFQNNEMFIDINTHAIIQIKYVT